MDLKYVRYGCVQKNEAKGRWNLMTVVCLIYIHIYIYYMYKNYYDSICYSGVWPKSFFGVRKGQWVAQIDTETNGLGSLVTSDEMLRMNGDAKQSRRSWQREIAFCWTTKDSAFCLQGKLLDTNLQTKEYHMFFGDLLVNPVEPLLKKQRTAK